MEKLMNKRQVAETFGLTVKAIDKWVCDKKIPYIKLSRKCVRFVPSEIEAFLETFRMGPSPDIRKPRRRR